MDPHQGIRVQAAVADIVIVGLFFGKGMSGWRNESLAGPVRGKEETAGYLVYCIRRLRIL